jgi:tetratricopeptide (TPR) repeat protein
MIYKLMMKASILLLAGCAFGASTPVPSARDLLFAGRINEALEALNVRVQSNPQDAEAFHLLSRAYFQVQRWDESIRNGERAITLNPNESNYHLWLGRAYGEKADASSFITAIDLAKKVREQFERAVQLDGNNVPARSDLAEFYADAPGFLGGGKDKARAQAEMMMKADPAAAHWVLGVVSEKEKNYDAAEQEYKTSLQAGGMRAREWVNLASFYKRRKRFDDMEGTITKAVVNTKGAQHVLYECAEILYSSGRNFNLAAQLLRKYLGSGDPNQEAPLFQAHYLLGQVLEKQGDKRGAAQEYQASLALARDFKKAQNALQRVSGNG